MSPTSAAAAQRSASEDQPVELEPLLSRVFGRIAPSWPLDRFIAVNPLWGFVDRPLPEVAARLAALCGARLLMPHAWYREQLLQGDNGRLALETALEEAGRPLPLAELLGHLQRDPPEPKRRPSLVDVIDAQRRSDRTLPWREFVVQSLSQLCAAYFDQGQAQLRPDTSGGLYACWRRWALADRGPSLLMGMRGYACLAKGLPGTPQALIGDALRELAVPHAEREAYLTALLLDLNGWAACCAQRAWTARLGGHPDPHLVDLLGMRLAWELLLFRAGDPERAALWRAAIAQWRALDVAAADAQALDWHLQRAVELRWQSEALARLSTPGPERTARHPPAVQAIFCIDVRSEVFRRALEAQSGSLQTLGFAGFFGVPLEYLPAGAATARPQLPGLLAPQLRATDAGFPAAAGAQRAGRSQAQTIWNGLKVGPLSCFAFIESAGPLYLAELLAASFGRRTRSPADGADLPSTSAATRRPRLTGRAGGGELLPPERSALAASMLRAMSLTRDFARLVLLMGHGSETSNNPFAASLDCGACGGQTGEVNARVAAALLNEPAVRTELIRRGIHIPEATHFLPALHNTTTDEVTLFDVDELPASHAGDLTALRVWLDAAGEVARRERAPKLGLTGSAQQLRARCTTRALDWAEVRPEWGLADNAAFIVAPRARTRHLDFGGRSFLHDYRHQEDPGYKVLEQIMTAPMLVTHWINFQYYASTVDNRRFGSGNKLLHNVVGGHLGVFEGNGGDLRIGLPLQSLHDGERWVHTPLRLSVIIEAPTAAIEGVLHTHDTVRALAEHQWIHLFQIDGESGEALAYRDRAWVRPTLLPREDGRVW